MKAIILFITCAALSCGPSHRNAPGAQQAEAPVSKPSQTNASTNNQNGFAVGPVELHGSWNGSDVKLDRWKDTNDSKIPHPASFDVLFTIENRTDSAIQDGDVFVITTIDFIVAPTYAYSGDVNKVIKDNNWSRNMLMDDLRLEPVPFLLPHGKAQLKFKGFNLAKVVKQFDGKEDTLWLWALRVNVRVLDRQMRPVALGQVILPMLPTDIRLGKK